MGQLMDVNRTLAQLLTRRQLFSRSASTMLGAAALSSLMNPAVADTPKPQAAAAMGSKGALGGTHFPATAKRVIYLFQNGGPSQIDTFDYHPSYAKLHKTELPATIRMGQRLTGMTSGQSSFPVAAPIFKFAQHGKSGAWMSELLPHHAKIADDIAIIKSIHTEAVNHDPACTYIQTGQQLPGRPAIGAWLSYGIGTDSENLPAYVVLISIGTSKANMQPLYSRMWGSGFLPSEHQGVRFRGGKDPVLYLSNPEGIDGDDRRNMLDATNAMNKIAADAFGDPEISTRIAQYEMAYRMQTSVPELMDVTKEPASTFELYGEDAKKPGTFAANCLLARRMAERGVRCIQLFHRGWDQHGDLPRDLRAQCKDVDQASAALILDLKNRGMLEDTLVVWGGEFGRTIYSQGAISETNYGRDHHGRCFTMWMSGGGVKPGITYGQTDDYSYNITENPVHIHDLNATILHCLGIQHDRLTFKFQGLDQRLTGVDRKVNVVKAVLA
jgi:uncharacterized protein (DUF1501 family)